MPTALAVTTLTNIPPDRYERIQQVAEEQVGVGLTGNSGTVEEKGVQLEYNYDGKSTLTISVLKVPKHLGIGPSPQWVISGVEKAIQGIA